MNFIMNIKFTQNIKTFLRSVKEKVYKILMKL